MSDSIREALQEALLRLFRPIASLLLEAGVGIGEVIPHLKRACVEAALESSGTARSKPNISRIAVLTGLTRHEVAAILRESCVPEAPRGRQRAERVLTGWWNDADFQTPVGKPAILPLIGRKRSFNALCQRYSGSVEPARVLEELLRVSAVRQLSDERVEALSRTYATVRWSAEGIDAVGAQLAEHCATLTHNLQNPTRALFAGRVVNTHLKPEFLRTLRRDLEDEAANAIETADRMLNDSQHAAAEGDADAAELGMAIYLFERVSHLNGKATPQEGGKTKVRRAPRGGRPRRRPLRPKNKD